MIDSIGAALAARVAASCGVTRLADITHLDNLGIPVFQAVRPWSRGLSVHQGKGLNVAEASLGALMEAIEQQRAEAFADTAMVCTFAELPLNERSPTVCDFAADESVAPSADEPLAWVMARTLAGRTLWAPFDVISLDFSRRGDARLARSSNGLACRFDLHDAFATGLLELVERDAVAKFLSRSPISRMLAQIDLATVSLGWLASLIERLRAARVKIAVYHAPAVVAVTFVCELLEPGAGTALRGAVWGSGCHPCPETALKKAVLEAAQSRLTAISGARDDFLPAVGSARAGSIGFSLPPPSSQPTIVWSELVGGLEAWQPTASAVASRLARAGYSDCAFVDLSPPEREVSVVKALAPGLGSGSRLRRSVVAS